MSTLWVLLSWIEPLWLFLFDITIMMIHNNNYNCTLLFSEIVNGAWEIQYCISVSKLQNYQAFSCYQLDSYSVFCGNWWIRMCFWCIQAILTGDYILSAASVVLARIGNDEVMKVMCQILEDLVAGK